MDISFFRSIPVFFLVLAYSIFRAAAVADPLYSSQLQSDLPPITTGLSWNFYEKSCPNVESIVKKRLKVYLDKDITQAAGLLRLHFHDCFVQGCDASVLLAGSTSGPGEQSAIPNLTLRPEAFQIITDIKEYVEAACPSKVSCADIVALAARESVRKARGPYYPVPLGRRDSVNFANLTVTLASLPPPTANVTGLLRIFSAKNLDVDDLVALSGGHTIGRAHCASFANRLSPDDPNLNKRLAAKLHKICPTSNSSNVTNMDIRTPNRFDNKYYVGLARKEGLFTSDASLVADSRTQATVLAYEQDESLFFRQFSLSMIKMSQLGVMVGSEGEIRKDCSVPNAAWSSLISSLSDMEEEREI